MDYDKDLVVIFAAALSIVIVTAGFEGFLSIAGHRVGGERDDRDVLRFLGSFECGSPPTRRRREGIMSINTRSGFSLWVISTPFCPSSAMTTSKPLRLSRRNSMSRFISLSSTSSILGMNVFPGEVENDISSVELRYEEHCNVIYADTQLLSGCKNFVARHDTRRKPGRVLHFYLSQTNLES